MPLNEKQKDSKGKQWLMLLFFVPLFSFSQVSEEQQRRDSVALLNAEKKAQIDTTAPLPLELKTEKELKTIREENDSLLQADKRNHKPSRALWMSAVLPGLGQAYNKKYWKIPIVYAGFAGLGYAVYYTSSNYNQARTAYRAEMDDDPNTHGSYQGISDANTLRTYRDYHRRNLTISGLCMALWYGLNLIDAVVDAHLYSFNVSDNLTMNWSPMLAPNTYGASAQMSGGLQVSFQF